MRMSGLREVRTGRARALPLAMVALIAAMAAPLCRAQEPGEQAVGRGGMGQFAGMQRVAGEVTAVSGPNVAVKTEEGASVTVVTTDNTRLMRGRGVSIKVADLKPGDGVMAVGNLDAANKTLHAAALFATDAAQVKAMKENLGKTYIVGRVTGIDLDNAKMTIERPDHVSQTIGLDESTSFRRGGAGRDEGANGVVGGAAPQAGSAPAASGESITLADIKVGDEVRGTGALKSGIFVPAQLVVGAPGGRRRRAGAGGSSPANTSGAAATMTPGAGATRPPAAGAIAPPQR